MGSGDRRYQKLTQNDKIKLVLRDGDIFSDSKFWALKLETISPIKI